MIFDMELNVFFVYIICFSLYFKGKLLIVNCCFVYNILMIWQISVGITKLVLLWKIIFSAHDLLDDLNGKIFHTFFHANLLIYDLVLVKLDYVVRGTHSNCIFHVLILLFYFADMIKMKRILIGITKLVLSRKIIFSNPDLCNDLNGKLLHTFVSTNLLLYDLLSDCIVTVTT